MNLSKMQLKAAFFSFLFVSAFGSAIEARAPFGLSEATTECSTRQAFTSMKSVPTKYNTESKTVTLVAGIVLPPVKTVTPTQTATITQPVVVMTTTTTSLAGMIVRILLSKLIRMKLIKYRQSTITISAVTTSTVIVTESASKITETATATTTVTVSGDLVVVPTRDEFLPVISTLPGTTSRRRGVALPKRLEARAGRAQPKKSYPKFVACLVVKTIYKVITTVETGSSTRTVTAPTPTATVFSLSAATITETVLQQPALTTTTVTATIVSRSTTTPVPATTPLTRTVTATVILPASTSYAACDAANLVGAVDGQTIVATAPTPELDLVAATSVTLGSPADCCAACLANPLCAASDFSPPTRACLLLAYLDPDQCAYEGDHAFEVFYARTGAAGGSNDPHVVSNGNCGFYTGGTPVGS